MPQRRTKRNLITRAARMVDGGYSALGRACGVHYRTIQRWEDAARLPLCVAAELRPYHENLAAAVDNKITAAEFLAWTRAAWKKYYDEGGAD